jgi:peptidoglycan hydrolase-like protein with peptidoglycan-binding domain
MPYIKIPQNFNPKDGLQVKHLSNALAKLGYENISITEKSAKDQYGSIKYKQDDKNITEEIDLDTINKFNIDLHDKFITDSNYRVAKLNQMLQRLGILDNPSEKVDEKTREAIKKYQKEKVLIEDGKVSEEVLAKIQEDFFEKKFESKRQVNKLQKELLMVRRIAKIDKRIADDELSNKKIGDSTKAFIVALQEKYKINPTGKVDNATNELIRSVMASRGEPKRILKKENTHKLSTINQNLRLNMNNPAVSGLQQVLTHIGHKINKNEYDNNFYGKSTREAVLKFQKERGLAETGSVEGKTKSAINAEALKMNPNAASAMKSKYHLRGTVHDSLWKVKGNMQIKIYEKTILNGRSDVLVEKRNFENGFFDISYIPTQPKEDVNLIVELFDNGNLQNDAIKKVSLKKVQRITWLNFTIGDEPYRGEALFLTLTKKIKKEILRPKDKSEEEITNKFISIDKEKIVLISNKTGINTDDLIRLFLSYHLAKKSKDDYKIELSNEVFYAFLVQNLPIELPSDLGILLEDDWTTGINKLVQKALSGIGFMDALIREKVIENAIEQNFVSRNVYDEEEDILRNLEKLQEEATLKDPILVGNGSLRVLIENSYLDNQKEVIVAQAFIKHGAFNADFWRDLKKNRIADDEIKDFKTTVALSGITKNFVPALVCFQKDIRKGATFKRASDLAKQSQKELEKYITDKIKDIPSNLKKNEQRPTQKEIKTYAEVLRTRAAMLYPAVALTARLKQKSSTIMILRRIKLVM